MKALSTLILFALLSVAGIATACEKGEKLPYVKMSDKLFKEGFDVALVTTDASVPIIFTRFERKSDRTFAVIITDMKGVSTCSFVSKPQVPAGVGQNLI